MAELTPGTTSKATPAASRAAASSPPRANTNGSPPLSRTTVWPGPAPLDQQVGDLVLGQHDVARRLAHVDPLGAGRGQLEQGRHREPVVDHDIGPAEHLGAPDRQQAGIAWSGAHQVDGHPPSVGAALRAPGCHPDPARVPHGGVTRWCR